jgi:GntR family transcriptional regulator
MKEIPKEARLPLYISVDDPKPMYAQVEEQLRDLILADHLKPETRLPSSQALARDLHCSVITTRRVYKDLEREGFVRTRSGRGPSLRRSRRRWWPLTSANPSRRP